MSASFARRKGTLDELARWALDNEKRLSQATTRTADADTLRAGLNAEAVAALDQIDPETVRTWLKANGLQQEAKGLVATATSETAKFPAQYAEILAAIDQNLTDKPDDVLAKVAKAQADEVMAELAALNTAAKDHPAK